MRSLKPYEMKRASYGFLNKLMSTSTFGVPSKIVPKEITFGNPPPFKISPFETANLARFVNDNKTLQKLIMLGINISTFDKLPDISEYILKANFESDIKKYLAFLYHMKIPMASIAQIITLNPYILRENIEDMEIRINYLKSRKFTVMDIAHLITTYPKLLTMSTVETDQKLGFLQRIFELSNCTMANTFLSYPAIINCNFDMLKLNIMTMNSELEFEKHEIQKLLILCPKCLLIDRFKLIPIYRYLTINMAVPKASIFEWPIILLNKLLNIKSRHLYLKSLQLNQYDPTRPGYLSLETIYSCISQEFCVKCTGKPVQSYYDFLKTL